jgi:metallo-beta-lactamase class B
MKRIFPFLALLIIIRCEAFAQYGDMDKTRSVTPFRIFDNLYYVGNDIVSAYLITTSNGMILIDALYAKDTTYIPEACKQLGLDVKQIKYILPTHGHFDHYEGAAYIQRLTGARVGMTGPDWEIAEGKVEASYKSVSTYIRKDWVIGDGDSLKLGNTVLHFYETPGHTPGVLSIAFPVNDGKNIYQAFMFGGIGLNFEGVARTEMYLKSVDRIMRMKGIQVNISNHPGPGKIFEREDKLKTRVYPAAHPFVAPEEFQSWLTGLKKAAELKLAEEKKKQQLY